MASCGQKESIRKRSNFAEMFRIIVYNRNIVNGWRFAMGSTTTAMPPRAKRAPALRGACEKSARSVISVIRRTTPGKASPEALTDLVDSLTGVIERTAELLLAGKHVRVIEDDETMTTDR